MELDRRGCVVQPSPRANRRREEPADKAKPFDIPKREVWEAFKHVKANQGAAGVDGQSVAAFEAELSDNLYKLWNRMSSGSYFPPPVRRVYVQAEVVAPMERVRCLVQPSGERQSSQKDSADSSRLGAT